MGMSKGVTLMTKQTKSVVCTAGLCICRVCKNGFIHLMEFKAVYFLYRQAKFMNACFVWMLHVQITDCAVYGTDAQLLPTPYTVC